MDRHSVLLLILFLFEGFQFVHTVLLLEVGCQVVLPPACVVAQLTLEGLVVSVQVHVVSQPLPVSIHMAAHLTLMRLCLGMASLVSRHRGRRVCGEPAGIAHERPLVGVLEPHVLIQGRLLHSSVTTMGTMESHCSLLCVLP